MPIVKKISLPSNEDILLITKLSWAESLMILRLKKFEESIDSLENKEEYCICIHPESSHRAVDSIICSYNNEYCKCDGYKPIIPKFKVITEITLADVFEFEVKDHSERDSLNWWSEFIAWEKINGSKESSILCNS